MADDKTDGQIAYEAWRETRRKQGVDHPFWEHLSDAERASWEAAGEAVRDAVNDARDPRSRP